MSSTWPLILAGPIVRRVEPKLASVWIALREPGTVTLDIWKDDVRSTSSSGSPVEVEGATPEKPKGERHFASANAQTRRFGERLHVAVVTWEGSGTERLEDGTLYAYNVTVTPASGGAEDLNSLGLLETDVAATPPVDALGYADGRLPAFVTVPEDLESLRVVHGSCRKIHGPGEDALALIDQLIESNRTTVASRPQQLFMTGDQIYADEVPDLVLPALNAVGHELIGKGEFGDVIERLPMLRPDATVRHVPAHTSNFPAGCRQTFLQKSARFTSGAAKSHLLTLGEFYAMYLFSWSNALWPESYPTEAELYDDIVPGGRARHATAIPEDQLPDLKTIKALRKVYPERVELTDTFRNALPKVRRVLANVATYMIMDDHEVTDDWYLTDGWRHEVLQRMLGRYVIGNGLIAYGVFQGWGNDPKAFETGKNAEFLAKASALYPEVPAGQDSRDPALVDADHAALQTLAGMVADQHADPEEYVRWHYTVDGPKHHVIVLDTRNWRKGRSLRVPPGLVEENALERQIARTTRPDGKEVTFVVSAVPVLGLPTIEEVLQPTLNRIYDVTNAARGGEGIGAARKDPEPWAFDPHALENLLARLRGHERVIFLSGDVHYALSAELDYWQRSGGAGAALAAKARFVQLTASAFKNTEESLFALASSTGAQYVFEELEAPVDRVVWDAHEPSPVSMATGLRAPAQHRNALRESPVLLETRGWPEGTSITRNPDRAWRFRLSRDPRPDAERPSSIQHLVIAPEINDQTTDLLSAYVDMQARHHDVLRRSDPRLALFDTNFGLASFKRGATLTLDASDLDAIAASHGLDDGIVERLRQLEDRPVLDECFRAVVKAHVGHHRPLTVAELDAIEALATRTPDVLCVQHDIHATHKLAEPAGKAEVFTRHVASLAPTTEAPPSIVPTTESEAVEEPQAAA